MWTAARRFMLFLLLVVKTIEMMKHNVFHKVPQQKDIFTASRWKPPISYILHKFLSNLKLKVDKSDLKIFE